MYNVICMPYDSMECHIESRLVSAASGQIAIKSIWDENRRISRLTECLYWCAVTGLAQDIRPKRIKAPNAGTVDNLRRAYLTGSGAKPRCGRGIAS